MPKSESKNLVDDFLKDPSKQVRGGTPCATCSLSNVAEINEAALHFNSKRASGQTTASWTSLVKHVLSKAPFNLPVKSASLRAHLENHCNVEIS